MPIPRPRERVQTVPTPEDLEFELLQELKKKYSSAPPEGPTVEISFEAPARPANDSVHALEILEKAAAKLELEPAPSEGVATDDGDNDLPDVLKPARASGVAMKLLRVEDPSPASTQQSGPDEPPRSSRRLGYEEPSVIVTDEVSQVDSREHEPRPGLARAEMPTEPTGEAPHWEVEHARQSPTMPPARRSRPKRWRLAVPVLLVAGAAAGYVRFPAEYTHTWQWLSSYAKTWGGSVQTELSKRGWL